MPSFKVNYAFELLCFYKNKDLFKVKCSITCGNIPVYSDKPKCFFIDLLFLQTMLSPLCGLCLLPHFICMQHSLDIDFSHTDKKLLAAGLQFLCFLLDLWLINIAHRFKNLSMKLSLMINGSRVNRRCRVCK